MRVQNLKKQFIDADNKSMKKYSCLIYIFVAFLFLSPIAAQEIENEYQEVEATEENTVTETEKRQIIPIRFAIPESPKDMLGQFRLTVAKAPALIINGSAPETSIPVSVISPTTLGVFWRNNFFVSTEPNLSFFMGHYLWDEKTETAYIAEIENRTSMAFSFLIGLPVVFTFNITKKSNLKLSASFEYLLRFGILAIGVKPDDSGTSGNAESDVRKINDWFMKNSLYVGGGVAWMFEIASKTSTLQLGPEVKVHIPLGQLEKLNGMMISAGLKLII